MRLRRSLTVEAGSRNRNIFVGNIIKGVGIAHHRWRKQRRLDCHGVGNVVGMAGVESAVEEIEVTVP